MSIHDMIDKTRSGLTAHVVFGDRVQQDGIVVIPAARVAGGAGGGEGTGPSGDGNGTEGFGGGFGLRARPVGAFVIRDSDVRWRPAVDLNVAIAAAAALGVAALLFARAVVVIRHGQRPK